MTLQIITGFMWCALFVACWLVRKRAHTDKLTYQQKMAILESSHHLLLAGIAGSLAVALLHFLIFNPGSSNKIDVWRYSGFLFISAICARIYSAQAVLGKELTAESSKSEVRHLSGQMKDVAKKIENLDSNVMNNFSALAKNSQALAEQFASMKIIPDREKNEPIETMLDIFGEIKAALAQRTESREIEVRLASEQLKLLKQPIPLPSTLKIEQTQFEYLLKAIEGAKLKSSAHEDYWNKIQSSLDNFSSEVRGLSSMIAPDKFQANVDGYQQFMESLDSWKSYLASANDRDIAFQTRMLEHVRHHEINSQKLDDLMTNAGETRHMLEQLLPHLSLLTVEATKFLDEWRVGQNMPSSPPSQISMNPSVRVELVMEDFEKKADLTEEKSESVKVVRFRPGVALVKEVWESYRMIVQGVSLVHQQVNLLCNSLRRSTTNHFEEDDISSGTNPWRYYSKEIKFLTKELDLAAKESQLAEHQASYEKVLQMIWDSSFSGEKILRRPDCDMYLITPSFIEDEFSVIENLWQQSSVPPRFALLMVPIKKQLTLLVRLLLDTSQQVLEFYTQEPPFSHENLGMIIAPNLVRMQDVVKEINLSTKLFQELESQQNELLKMTLTKIKWRSKKKLPPPHIQAS